MDTIDETKAIIQSLSPGWITNDSVQVDMLRLDLIHPVISGNKWYKLKYNLEHAKKAGYNSVLTFGGAYSNHLIATAGAARAAGFSSIGIVRGDYGKEHTQTLKQCVELGMQLHFVSREDYGKKNDREWLEQLAEKFDQPFIIPEGGANEWGRAGAEQISSAIPDIYTHICVSVGTGTTLAGLRNALPASSQLIGFVPMKGGIYLSAEVKPHLKQDINWLLFDNWHFGGFGKSNGELVTFMNEFYDVNAIPLDIVYTGKMMYGLRDLLSRDFFPGGAKVLCIHTGGLQGNSSASDRLSY